MALECGYFSPIDPGGPGAVSAAVNLPSPAPVARTTGNNLKTGACLLGAMGFFLFCPDLS